MKILLNFNQKFEAIKEIEDITNIKDDSLYIHKDQEKIYEVAPDIIRTKDATIARNELIDSYPSISKKVDCSFVETPQTKINADNLQISFLKNALIYGGRIQSRTQTTHTGGQLILRQDLSIFNDSYNRMDGCKTLPSDLLDAKNNGIFINSINIPNEHYTGTYYLIGNCHSHFGHFLLEGLSRIWALQLLPHKIRGSLKYIIYEPGLIPPARRILNLIGIDDADIVCAPHSGAVFETVIVPSIGFCAHKYAFTAMNWVYDKIANQCLSNNKNLFQEKIYLSRNNIGNRSLSNQHDIEKLFSKSGYKLVRPEDLPIGDQIKLSICSKSLAGATGSQMYLSIFQNYGNSNNIILCPFDFTLKDDAIIAGLRKNSSTYIVGSPMGIDQNWSLDVDAVENFLNS